MGELLQLLTQFFSRATPDVGRLDPVQARTDPASLFKQDPFFSDTLSVLLERLTAEQPQLATDPNLPGNTLGEVSNKEEQIGPSFETDFAPARAIRLNPVVSQADPASRAGILGHESAHVMQFAFVERDLRNAVRERFPEALERVGSRTRDALGANVASSETEHFAGAFQNAWDFIRKTPGAERTIEAADHFWPGTKPIIEWLAKQGFKRETN